MPAPTVAQRTRPFRDYDPDRDADAVHRIWRECGWINEDDKPGEASMDIMLSAGRARVAELHGEAECLVHLMPGTVRYLDTELPKTCVSAVTTSRVARKQGFAGRLTAEMIATEAAGGALVASLGMFDQGFYNRLGFGTGPYEIRAMVDPGALAVEPARRPPRRLTTDDAEIMHANRLQRMRCHGSCTITAPEYTRGACMHTKNGFGFGYFDEPGGTLSHHLYGGVRGDVEYGPYHVSWLAYSTYEQLLELLGVLRNLGDQVRGVKLVEPAGIQLQDLQVKPIASLTVTEATKFDTRTLALAYWQMRICDLPGCLERTHLPGGDNARFNLELSDPIEAHLPDDAPWQGTAGEYVVGLGRSSGAEPGRDTSLPTMRTTVNAFTRLWLGVRPPTGLAVTDDIDAPPELLEALDNILRLPQPHTEWPF